MLYLFLVVPRVPSYTLFPYTTLFRSTILGWAYYGEKCFQYLFQSITAIRAYRIIFVLFIFIGATATLDAVWALADVLNGLMAIPNLIGLLGLSGIIVIETKRFQEKLKKEREGAKKTVS